MAIEIRGFLAAQSAKPMKITGKQFRAYEQVRVGGQTNMLDIERVCELAAEEEEGILTPQAVANIIIKHYKFLKDKYLPSNPII